MSKEKGFTDNPIEKEMEDLFSVGKYIKGLSRFIQSCDTPLTIAVQGDWGSGKTSMMNMVKGSLGDRVVPVWFNTWEFSQFSMDEELCFIFISYLLKELSKNIKGEKNGKAKALIEKLKKISPYIIGTASEILSKNILSKEDVQEILGNIQSETSVDIINHLKEEFQGVVNELLKDKGEEARVVIFVDDLDRLQPSRAVELLEILKIFLDCEKCVYVLAIDYEVVSQGIKEKYSGGLSLQKGRKFFDKIIQVPFKMPVAHYKIEEYVGDALDRLKIGKEYADKYKKFIEVSVGYNPRTMKRLFNSYLLLKEVQTEENSVEKVEQPFQQLLLFGSLCMQMSFEKIYNYIVMNTIDMITVESFNEILKTNNIREVFSKDELGDILSVMDENEEEEFNSEDVNRFFKVLAESLKEGDKTKKITEKSIDELRKTMEMTSVTASNIERNGKGTRYPKQYDENFIEYTLEDAQVESFNSCKIEYYIIDGKKSIKNSITFADFFVDVLAYAYQKNKKGFNQLMEEAEKDEKNKYRRLFVIGENKNTASKEIPSTGIRVSTYSSNDVKVSIMRGILKNLELECDNIMISMKEARMV